MTNQMFKSLDPDGVTEFEFEIYSPVTEDEINEMIAVHVDSAKMEAEHELQNKLDVVTFPHFGYTTAQKFEDSEEYEEFLRQVLAEEVEDFRQAIFDMIKDQIENA